VKFFIGRIGFEQLGAEREAALNAVETRFKLPPDQVEMLIAAGRDALKTNNVFRQFLGSMPHMPPLRPAAPVASTLDAPHEAQAQ
jgi:NTE family protein